MTPAEGGVKLPSLCKPFSSEFFSPARELEEVAGKPPHWQRPARMTFPSTDFPQTEYFYTSARATWKWFAPSDSQIPAVDGDQTHVVMMKGVILHRGIKKNNVARAVPSSFMHNVAELTGALVLQVIIPLAH